MCLQTQMDNDELILGNEYDAWYILQISDEVRIIANMLLMIKFMIECEQMLQILTIH